MKNVIKVFVLLTLFCSCENPLGDLELTSENFCAGTTDPFLNQFCVSTKGNTWDFTNSSDYNFNSSYISLDTNGATLADVKQSFSGADFSAGTLNGVIINGSSRLSLDSSASSFRSVDEILPEKSSSIVTYWKMDGNFLDSSGKGYDLAIVGSGASFGDGKVGSNSALYGPSGSLKAENHSENFSQGFTVSTWVKSRASGAWAPIVNKGNSVNMDFQLVFQNNESFLCRYFNSTASIIVSDGTSNMNADIWRHIVCTLDIVNQKLNIYVDGVLMGSSSTGGLLAPSVTYDLVVGSSGFEGHIDELAIWNTHLNTSEISLIYQNQKQRYAGYYDSPVIDLGASESWTNLNVTTNLPFGKEIVPQVLEESLNYSDLSSSFSNDLVAYWNFNELTANTVSGEDFEDLSINSNHLNESGGVSFGEVGKFGHTAKFDGVDDYLEVLDNSSLDLSTDVTLSVWFKSDGELGDSGVYGGLVGKSTDGGSVSYEIRVYNSSYEFLVRQVDGSFKRSRVNFNPKIVDGEWHHIVGIANSASGTVSVYLDGVLQSGTIDNTFDGTIAETTHNLRVGRDYGANNFEGFIDEVGIWGRALTSTEVGELYRRGANRIKYQVRTCVDSTCSSNPSWVGPGGDAQTYYSELYNRSNGNITFNCSDNNSDSDSSVCVDDEVSLANVTLANSPRFTFNNMAPSASISNSRYFQYRVLMEADENSACSSQLCLPELSVVSVEPTGRYFGGSPVISSKNGISYSTINSISIEETGSCSITYQLSPDGVNYYYFNGSTWTLAASESSSFSSSKALTIGNIGSFSNSYSPGSLHFKAFLNSDTSDPCSVKEIRLERVE